MSLLGTLGSSRNISQEGDSIDLNKPMMPEGNLKQELESSLSSETFGNGAVQKEVYEIISILLKQGEIREDQVKLPRIIVSENIDTSSYIPIFNSIQIKRSDIGSLDTYGEEIFHWLRNQLRPEGNSWMGNLPREEHFAVEEFFGWIGSCVVRDLCIGMAKDPAHAVFRVNEGADFVSAINSNHVAVRADSAELTSFLNGGRVSSISGMNRTLSHFSALNLDDSPNLAKVTEGIVGLLKAQFDLYRAEYQGALRNLPIVERFETSILKLLPAFIANFEKTKGDFESDRPASYINVIRNHQEISKQIVSLIGKRLKEIEHISSVKSDQKKQFDEHCLGYAAGQAFLMSREDPQRDAFQLLRADSRTVYFNHVFGRTPDTSAVPSWFEIVREKIRVAIAWYSTPLNLLEKEMLR